MTAITIAPFWMFMYWLFLTKGRWYQGRANDFMEREICDLKFEMFKNAKLLRSSDFFYLPVAEVCTEWLERYVEGVFRP